jgi:hypothetical protein
MRRLLLPLSWTLASVALQISGYQNPRLAEILLVGVISFWTWWLLSNETLLNWYRERKTMTFWMAILIGAVIGGGTGLADGSCRRTFRGCFEFTHTLMARRYFPDTYVVVNSVFPLANGILVFRKVQVVADLSFR